MKYGYARVSTDDQNPALQLAALKRAGCKTIFKDEGISGATPMDMCRCRQTVIVAESSLGSNSHGRIVYA
jgi:DNA invertase Pin-like site-specific DNA recombinase